MGTVLDETLRNDLIELLRGAGDDLRPIAEALPQGAAEHAWGVAWSLAPRVRSHPLPPSLAAGLLAALEQGAFAPTLRSADEIAERYALVGQLVRLAQISIAAAEGRAGDDMLARALGRIEALGLARERFEHPEAALCTALVSGRLRPDLADQLSRRVSAGAALAWALGLRDDVPARPLDPASDPLDGVPNTAAALCTLAGKQSVRPLDEVLAERARWEEPLRSGALDADEPLRAHAIEVVRGLRWLSEPWWPELALTPWAADEVTVREHAAAAQPPVPGPDPRVRAVRRAWGAAVIALAATDQRDEASVLAALWPNLVDLDPGGWEVAYGLLPEALAAAVGAMVEAFDGPAERLAAAAAGVQVAATAALPAGLAQDPAAVEAAERHLQTIDLAPEPLVLGHQESREEGLAMAIRAGARLWLDMIEILGVLGSPLEAEAIGLLRALPTDPGDWLEATAPFAARARTAALRAAHPAAEDLRAVMLDATTALALLGQGLLATDEPQAVRWLCAEASAAWTRTRTALDAVREGRPVHLVPDPDAESIARDDLAECWSLDHLEGSEARWEGFAAEMRELLDHLERGTLGDRRAAWAHVARWASLDGVVPELQGLPLAVGLRLQELARTLSAG